MWFTTLKRQWPSEGPALALALTKIFNTQQHADNVCGWRRLVLAEYWLLIGRQTTPALQRKAINNLVADKTFSFSRVFESDGGPLSFFFLPHSRVLFSSTPFLPFTPLIFILFLHMRRLFVAPTFFFSRFALSQCVQHHAQTIPATFFFFYKSQMIIWFFL